MGSRLPTHTKNLHPLNLCIPYIGIFSRVELVILVGVGGSIPGRPNNTVERGDVVVSQPEFQGGPLYVHCTGKPSILRLNEILHQTKGSRPVCSAEADLGQDG